MSTENNNDQPNKKSKKGPLVFLITFLAVITVAVIFIAPFKKVSNLSLELGDNIDVDPASYLRGASLIIDEADIDISKVDNFAPGTYPVVVALGPLSYNYTITVTDTTAPVITLAKIDDCLAIDKDFSIDDFVSETSDLSNTQTTHFSIGGISSDTLKFSNAGFHEFDIVCSDASGNTSTESFSVEFDKAPDFLLLSDKYVKTGTDFDAYKYSFAYDDSDGDITSKITVDTSDLNTKKSGDYEITYTVKNKKGVRQEQNITVHVGDKTDNNISVSKSDIETLLHYDYFNYEKITNGTYESTKNIVEPSSLNISTLNYKSSKGSRATASGGILSITPEYTYILTNRHVINSLANKKIEIMVYDKTIIPLGDYKTVTSSKSDIGIIRCSTEVIPDEKLLNLREYTIDKTVLSNLKADTKVFSLTKNFKQGSDISQTGVITNPNLTSLFSYFYFDAPKIQTTVPAQNGQSGSPVFDYNGNLISVISSTYIDIDGTTVYAYEHLEELDDLMKSFKD